MILIPSSTSSLSGHKKGKVMTEIMIVDDSLPSRHALKALLSQQSGIQVIAEASNGMDAVKLIQTRNPDLVLMDARMPVMDGLEATRVIKQGWPQIKVVILTMYPDCLAEALSAGADAFLVKGCAVEEVVATIHTLH
jgi:DNA-binding NarL/FixJ family response regulator